MGEAGDGEDAVTEAIRLRPDVVLMDIRMPVLDGIEATRRIVSGRPATRVVMLTTFGLDGYVYDALRVGASGFMLKDAPPEEIVAAVRIVANGEALLAPAVTRSVIEEFARRSPTAITPRPQPPAIEELPPGRAISCLREMTHIALGGRRKVGRWDTLWPDSHAATRSGCSPSSWRSAARRTR